MDENGLNKPSGTILAMDQICRTLTRFLQQIYRRDSIRSFCPDGHWIVDSHIPLDDLIHAITMDDEDQTDSGGQAAQKRLHIYRSLLQQMPFIFPFKDRIVLFRHVKSMLVLIEIFICSRLWEKIWKQIFDRLRLLLIFQFDVIMSLKTGIDTSIRWVSSFS
jgi:hypothetical protein